MNFSKPFLDLAASTSLDGRLKFDITPKEFYHLDEGNCKSIEQTVFNKFLNKFVSKKNYNICIRKITPDVIIHEIGHMIESETDSKLANGFQIEFSKDLREGNFSNLSLKNAVNQIMNKELLNYPTAQTASELYARFFQLLAMSYDVSGKASSYAYSFLEVYKALPNSKKWIEKNSFPAIHIKANNSIVKYSKRYTKALHEIEHNWSEEKVKPIHANKANKRWSGTVKSIKYDEY